MRAARRPSRRGPKPSGCDSTSPSCASCQTMRGRPRTRACGAPVRSLRARRGAKPAIMCDIDSKYLLSGFARCATCGRTLSVVSQSHRRKVGVLLRLPCSLSVAQRLYALVPPHRACRRWCEDDIVQQRSLRPKSALIACSSSKNLQPGEIKTSVDALRADLRALEQKIANLTTAVENGAAIASLVTNSQARIERDAMLAAIGRPRRLWQFDGRPSDGGAEGAWTSRPVA